MRISDWSSDVCSSDLWNSRWYANDKTFGGMLGEDIRVREYLKKKLKSASVGRVVIESPAKNARITIYSARPGVVIGQSGEDTENRKDDLQRLMGVPMHVNIEENRTTETEAQWIAATNAQPSQNRTSGGGGKE